MAFSEFVGRHESALLSFASAFLRDETLAQDVVQEAFLRAARDPHRLLKVQDNAASGRNWLLKVVRDLSIDSLRKKATERRALTGMAAIAEKSVHGPEVAMEAREQAQTARAAIDRLRPRLRELLILKVREQKSYKEIAEITGLSVTNVGFLLHQAMQELQKEVRASETRDVRLETGATPREAGGDTLQAFAL
ncbi:MAG TPA: sigma-70 family RNA polymerase sigma factor [Planctomycetota bacterium]|nr:sigma-70 family RNA polymerase sigma factor [Planctomycetota bacterium]